MTYEEKQAGCVALLFVFFSIIIFIVLFSLAFHHQGFTSARYEMQLEAVKEGHAEWLADQEGNVSFKWKKIEAEKNGK